MSSKSTSQLLYVLIILVSINLTATTYLIAGHPWTSVGDDKGDIPEDKANKLTNDAVRFYNSKDNEHLYELFDPLVKVQMTKKQLNDSLEKLHSLVGQIDTFVYSNSVIAGSHEGHIYYQLLYKVRLSGGQVDMDTGEMKLTVLNENDNLRLTGFFINALSNSNAK